MPSTSFSGKAGRVAIWNDGYIFCSEKDLPHIRHLFLASLESLGLQPNAKACFSSRLDRELAFLKIRFSCPDGHPCRRLARVTLIRYRRHLKSLCSSVESQELPPEVINASIASFNGVLSVSTARHRRTLESKALSPLRTFTDIPGQCPKTAQKCPKTAQMSASCIPSADNTGNI